MGSKNDWKTGDTDKLFEAILALKSVEQCENFFRDLMTEQEIEVFSARFKVAIMLDQGIPYRKIAKETGVSTATITRINYWLERGMNGYKLAISSINRHQHPHREG